MIYYDRNGDELKAGLSDEAKAALLNCFAHTAWIDEHGQDYYDELYFALYGEYPQTEWGYEWVYTDGLPENNGMTFESTGTPIVTMTNNGLQVATADTSNDVARYKYTNIPESIPYTNGIFEVTFRIDQYGSYNVSPYGNGVRVYAGLGLRGGDYVKCAELTFNKSGVMYMKEGTSWTLIDDTPIAIGDTHTVKIEQSLTDAKVYLDEVLIGTYDDLKENVSNPAFIVSRGCAATFTRFSIHVAV